MALLLPHSLYFVVARMRYLFSYKVYRRTLQVPLRTAHGVWTEREGLLVRLADENGRVGYGEIAPIPWFGTETVAQAEAACRDFGATVNAETLDAVPESLACVRFGLAMARTVENETSASLRLPVAALLPAGPAAVALLRTKIEAGFLAFKWKVGVSAVDEELGVFDDLLAEIPAHVKLRLDANGGWNRRQAARWLDRCAGRAIEFVEQPVAPEDEDSLRGLAEDFPVTLALDESVVRLAEARRWQAEGWRGVFVLKPALAGPLDELVSWIGHSKVDVVFSSAVETALGRSAILHRVLGGNLGRRALGFGVGEVFGDRLWDGPFMGPLADETCLAVNAGAELWNALN